MAEDLMEREDLVEYIEKNPADGFSPVPHYFPDGDFVSFYFLEDECYAERVDELLTAYYSIDSGALVGCKIKGVRRLLQTLGNFGVLVQDGPITLGFLFLAAGCRVAEDDPARKVYQEIVNRAKFAALDRKEIHQVAA
jgi:hypothetical protein